MRLRLNFGSHPTVTRVKEYNPHGRCAYVRLKYRDGTTESAEVSENEIEPLDPRQPYDLAVIQKELTRQADSVVGTCYLS